MNIHSQVTNATIIFSVVIWTVLDGTDKQTAASDQKNMAFFGG